MSPMVPLRQEYPRDEWDPLPLAHAVLADWASTPILVLAAWKCVVRGDCRDLTDLAYEAARRNA